MQVLGENPRKMSPWQVWGLVDSYWLKRGKWMGGKQREDRKDKVGNLARKPKQEAIQETRRM